ncbi:hypothetical protein EAG_05454 [Camponotus floridanus]|uniref:Myb/SANT-like DNA-binding domain-containing protein n=1 Tax=Camponotus floridanus TaxID=104421 RepID=E2ALG3_CAMFO|nr:uncharacterized protein LOC105253764 [Camponotus floridanus]XP_011260332.1 uncharacterized protein LOC105253764 [Camponotus floridanus]XP_011260333.1 uncharacterized protein LOC105253764 [Camponotus floridanus]EFN65721.1 hypothetical protein EAG_05454 [Camponotus floridanus]
MSDSSGDNAKYKWTPESTALLVSVWSDRQVQKQLEYAPRPQIIWESVARYMRKKGYNVVGKQCRSRMKQVLVCYREAKRAGTRAGVEQYYETIDLVLKNKRLEQTNINVGVDTVDATANYVKSPPKDVKTNKNLQMRLKVQEPVQSLFRTEALSPTWTIGCENDYPDSPESNETIIAKPYRVFSPTRDVAINTGERFVQIGNRAVQTNPIEKPMRENYQPNLLTSYPYGEIPYQNTVQNVQNQIIQENMQQYQNIQQQNCGIGWNQLPQRNVPANNQFGYQHNVNQQSLPNGITQQNVMQNFNVENTARQQNQLQQGALYADNRAMPQEPCKVAYRQNLATAYRQYQDTRLTCTTNVKQNGLLSPDYSPDVSQNLNDGFCLSKSDEKTHNLNETYNQPANLDNPNVVDATVMTNNATCNDDSMLLEFLLDSPIPSENGGKSRDSAVNTDEMPSAPFRKKKAQKLEQLVLNAINSQNEVVNKILAVQNDMVTRFLDVDRDRQNRLENRLDHLLNVVHATVLNKNDTSSSSPPLPEPAITSLLPPPKPGMIPPKLDLVPPKPCRVPCTIPNSNIELVNQNPILTRPGVISPIAVSPAGRKLGAIWSKLGPVSTSPFVKAQQRLGLQLMYNNDARTQSSAERRIAKETGKLHMDKQSLIYETAKLLEMERELEARIENARLEMNMNQILTARRKLFTQREPTPIIILTAAFLDAECRACEQDPPYCDTWESRKKMFKYTQKDDLLAGQGESYECLRQLNVATRHNYPDCEPYDTSTPAKLPFNNITNNDTTEPKQTIQQLARLVMNSARWRDTALQSQQQNKVHSAAAIRPVNQNTDIEYNATFTAPKANAPPPVPEEQGFMKGYDVTQQKQGNHNEATSDAGPLKNDLCGQSKFPIGFTTTMLTINDQKSTTLPRQTNGRAVKSLRFSENPLNDRKNNVRFMDEALAELQRMYIERQAAQKSEILPFTDNNGVMSIQNLNMIERYVSDLKKSIKDKDTDSDNDDEFLDTTTSMHPTCVARRGSLTSNGTASTETANSLKLGKTAANCRIS